VTLSETTSLAYVLYFINSIIQRTELPDRLVELMAARSYNSKYNIYADLNLYNTLLNQHSKVEMFPYSNRIHRNNVFSNHYLP